jgi:ribosomal protein S18 acetylase RimI-like enzyme
MLDNIKYHISDTISDVDKTSVLEILRDYSSTIIDTSSGKHKRRDLNIVIKDSRDKIIGGLIGFTEYGWLNIDFLSVDKDFRKQGLGRHIMTLAEQEAVKRECVLILVGTLENFAPGFYESLGYLKFDTRHDIYGNRGFMYKKVLKTF